MFKQWWCGYWPGGTGLVWAHGRLVFGCGHGFGRYWLPYPLLNRTVRLWNHFACRLLGHEWLPDMKGARLDEIHRVIVLSPPPRKEFCTHCNARRFK